MNSAETSKIDELRCQTSAALRPHLPGFGALFQRFESVLTTTGKIKQKKERARARDTHGQRRGRRQQGEALVGNTDDIIICDLTMHERWSMLAEGGGGGGNEEKEGAKLQRRQHLVPLLTLILADCFFFPSRSCFLSRGIIQAVGESSGANGDINLPQQESEKHQSGALNPALNDVHTRGSITHAWKQFITFPFHQTCHGLTRPVLRSSISPVSGCLPPAITPPHSPLTSERRKKKSISYVSKWCRADLHCY